MQMQIAPNCQERAIPTLNREVTHSMISDKVQNAMNDQIKTELESAHLYLSMAAYFSGEGYDGMASWMRAQFGEEQMHAMMFFDHIIERGGRVSLTGLAEPKRAWSSPLEAFTEAYKHEQFITSKINDLVALAAAEKDNAAHIMLQWFVKEQVEEEAAASKIVWMLEKAGAAGHALMMIDRELGRRGEAA